MTHDSHPAPHLRWNLVDFSARGWNRKLLLFEVTPCPRPLGLTRPSVDLVIAVDRSSSMAERGYFQAVELVRQICLRLGSQDRLSLVVFDGDVISWTLPPINSPESAAVDVARDLRRIGLGLGSNLVDGWSEAARLLHRTRASGEVQTILLLTDGHPSWGRHPMDEIVPLVRGGASQGIVTSTVGLGGDCCEPLLAQIARAGDGTFRTVQYKGNLASLAEKEMVGIAGLTAEDVTLRLQLDHSVEYAELLGVLRSSVRGDEWVIHLGRLFETPRRVLLDLATADEVSTFGFAELAYSLPRERRSKLERVELVNRPEQRSRAATMRAGESYVPWLVSEALSRIYEKYVGILLPGDVGAASDWLTSRLLGLPDTMTRGRKAVEALRMFAAVCERLLARRADPGCSHHVCQEGAHIPDRATHIGASEAGPARP